MAIAREFRIGGTVRINEVKLKGELLQSNNFGIRFLKNSSPVSRFAIVVSTKVSKFAVHRNRVKRALLEAVRQAMADVPKGFDYVFLTKSSIMSKTTDEIMREVFVFFKGLSTKLG